VSDSTVIGSAGGEHAHTQTTTEMPSHTHTGTTGNPNQSLSHSHTYSGPTGAAQAGTGSTFNGLFTTLTTSSSSDLAHTHNFTTNSAGSGGAHNNVQPTIMCNYIIRVK
jgi:microcystin-dependent protein